jgi:hypothetical protein
MRVVDGWIAAAGVAALVLASIVVLRSRQATRATPDMPIPSIHAPAPPGSAFPACRAQVGGMPRWRCQVEQARKQGRLRCYGQRLYYVGTLPSGASTYYPWPEQLQCANSTGTPPR